MSYQPELGQMLFGQPYKRHKVSMLVEAALGHIQWNLSRVQWNINQREMPDPFSNSGGEYRNETFHAQAYSWGDDDQPYNFKWRDVEISWYKYLGRGMSSNREVSPELCEKMLLECVGSIVEQDEIE